MASTFRFWPCSSRSQFCNLESSYDHYFPRVYNDVRYRVGDAETADDLTAQVFERALVNIGRYRRERAPFAAWLFAIARNAVSDCLRAQRWRRWLSLEVRKPFASLNH